MVIGIIKKFSDYVFVFVSSFFLGLILFAYTTERDIALVISVCVALFAILVYTKVTQVKERKTKQRLIYEKETENALNQLCIMQNTRLIPLFMECFTKKGYQVAKRKIGFYLPKQKIRVALFFNFEGLSKSDVITTFNLLKNDERAVIYCSFIEEKIKDFVIKFNGKINVIFGKEAVEFLSSENLLPKEEYELSSCPKQKIGWRDFLNKKTAKKHLAFGVVFIILSFFVPLKVYYIVSGTVMIILSVLSFAFSKNKTKTDLF